MIQRFLSRKMELTFSLATVLGAMEMAEIAADLLPRAMNNKPCTPVPSTRQSK